MGSRHDRGGRHSGRDHRGSLPPAASSTRPDRDRRIRGERSLTRPLAAGLAFATLLLALPAAASPSEDWVREVDEEGGHEAAGDDTGPSQGPEDDPPSRPRERWYGGWVLAGDAAWIAGAVAMAKLGCGACVGATVAGGYLIAPGIVHGVHGGAGNVLASLGVRVVLPIGGAWLFEPDYSGEETAGGARPGESVGGGISMMFGAMLGAVAAIGLDAALVAWGPEARATAAGPTVWVGRSGGGLGLRGAF